MQRDDLQAAHATDITAARALLHEAVERLSAQWVPCHAIYDGLIQELVHLAEAYGDGEAVAAHLHRIATHLERPGDGSQEHPESSGTDTQWRH